MELEGLLPHSQVHWQVYNNIITLANTKYPRFNERTRHTKKSSHSLTKN